MVGRTYKGYSFADAKAKREQKKNKFKASTAAERDFYRAIKKVAEQSGHIVDAYTSGAQIRDLKQMTKALDDYSKQLEPWAKRQSEKLLEAVSRSNVRAYQKQSKTIGKILRAEQKLHFGLSPVAKALQDEQVALIKSLPVEAGLRAQRIAAENFLSGTRAQVDPELVERFLRERRNTIEMNNLFAQQAGTKEFAEEMERSTEVAVNRAKLIARTETARANAAFVQTRASSVGSRGYIWRTTMDGAERHSHAKMNGKYVEYDSPPLLSDGTRGHAGTFPNCRCWQDVVLPEDVD
jgi:SPP1 gp7 family putative phage head morphogenesis protein